MGMCQSRDTPKWIQVSIWFRFKSALKRVTANTITYVYMYICIYTYICMYVSSAPSSRGLDTHLVCLRIGEKNTEWSVSFWSAFKHNQEGVPRTRTHVFIYIYIVTLICHVYVKNKMYTYQQTYIYIYTQCEPSDFAGLQVLRGCLRQALRDPFDSERLWFGRPVAVDEICLGTT